ncbi:MAG: PIN domain-containing protein [Armatimonadota bacterium]|nr:PIN domain-containing protein [Armatimonadota bacterium]
MDVLFLDANVLFSAAYSARSGLRRLWALPDVELVTSTYAVEEARRNLEPGPRRRRLDRLLRRVRVVGEAPPPWTAGAGRLPEKDRPILAAAMAVRATHLLTGDVTHFGPFLGQEVGGVRVLTPGEYLARRARITRER